MQVLICQRITDAHPLLNPLEQRSNGSAEKGARFAPLSLANGPTDEEFAVFLEK
jgi:hypothetical protein